MTSVTINAITFTQVTIPINVTPITNLTSYYGALGVDVFSNTSNTTVTSFTNSGVILGGGGPGPGGDGSNGLSNLGTIQTLGNYGGFLGGGGAGAFYGGNGGAGGGGGGCGPSSGVGGMFGGGGGGSVNLLGGNGGSGGNGMGGGGGGGARPGVGGTGSIGPDGVGGTGAGDGNNGSPGGNIFGGNGGGTNGPYGFFNGGSGGPGGAGGDAREIGNFGGAGGFGIKNSGTINTLINLQGGTSTNFTDDITNFGPLTYNGVAPNNYQIRINSTTNYGQLSCTNVTGTMNFSIATGSTLTVNIYSDVLTGITPNSLSGSYNGYNWSLVQNGANYDLVVTLQPTPTNVTAITSGYGDATITWIAPSGETVTNYVVTSIPPTSSVTTTSISTVITGLKNHEIYTFTVTANLSGGAITSANSNPVTSNYPCFLIGSKILTDKGYISIENLRKGDLVKTLKNDYLPIVLIGKSPIYNSGNLERIKNRLYTLPSDKYPELTEDLVLTGCHSILVDILTKEQEDAILANYGAYPITDGKVRLESYLDDKAKPYSVKGTFTIYHLALENENYFSNYGIWANGLLVESCSKRYLTELSNMELIE